jgi:hypothetical protein
VCAHGVAVEKAGGIVAHRSGSPSAEDITTGIGQLGSGVAHTIRAMRRGELGPYFVH